MYPVSRIKMTREYQDVVTPWGCVKIKVAKFKNKIYNIKPEYSDCKALAEKHGVPLKEVWQEAFRAFQSKQE